MNLRNCLKHAFALVASLVALAAAPAFAQPYPTPDTWGGEIGSRARLTGDWGGARDDLAKKGFVFDQDIYWTPQAIISGGKNETGGNWGNAVTSMHLDTAKAGMWKGGYFKLKAVTSFGHSIYRDTGALVPPNEAWALPTLEEDTGLQELSFLQLLSPKFGVIVGKIDMSVTPNVFYGDYRTGFANTSLNLPLASALVPLSAFGAGLIYLPNHEVHLTGMLLDPSGTIKSNNLGDAFDDGVMALGTIDVKTKFFGRPGHQNVLLSWSNKERVSLVQDPSNLASLFLAEKFPRLGDPGPVLREIIAARAPELLVPTQPLNTEDSTWAAVYSFEQFLWQPKDDHAHGVGMFFSAGVSDGRANPIKNSFTLGLGGKGAHAGRPNDNFGIGYSRTEFSDYFAAGLRDRFDIGLEHEDVLEIYYSFAAAPWLTVSPSFQAVRSAQTRTLDANHEFIDLDTTYLVGVRFGIRL
ncbi:MAG TPA: carbohydrate porin [Thermomonas sp.]|nr:carbohydrate porin [Thermomonas sp.]